MSWVERVAVGLLAVFVVACAAAGAQVSAAVGWYSLAGASLVASVLLGWGKTQSPPRGPE